jgi:hypothetical protein
MAITPAKPQFDKHPPICVSPLNVRNGVWVLGGVEPMRLRFARPAEDRPGWRKQARSQRKRLCAIQVDIAKPVRSRAKDNADVFRGHTETVSVSGIFKIYFELAPLEVYRTFLFVRDGHNGPSPLYVAACNLECWRAIMSVRLHPVSDELFVMPVRLRFPGSALLQITGCLGVEGSCFGTGGLQGSSSLVQMGPGFGCGRFFVFRLDCIGIERARLDGFRRPSVRERQGLSVAFGLFDQR